MQAFADAHLHMTDPDFGTGYTGIGDARLLFSCTARPCEWESLGTLSDSDPRVVPFYGVHPWYVSEFGSSSEALRSILEAYPKANVGEIGLDAQHPDMDIQRSAFRDQLSLASEFDRIASIHMVRSEKGVLDTLREVRCARVILHSFSSESYAKPFAALGCYMSVSPRILSKSPERISTLLRSIPSDRLLLESDAPNGHVMCVPGFAGRLSEIVGTDCEGLLSAATENAARLIG